MSNIGKCACVILVAAALAVSSCTTPKPRSARDVAREREDERVRLEVDQLYPVGTPRTVVLARQGEPMASGAAVKSGKTTAGEVTRLGIYEVFNLPEAAYYDVFRGLGRYLSAVGVYDDIVIYDSSMKVIAATRKFLTF